MWLVHSNPGSGFHSTIWLRSDRGRRIKATKVGTFEVWILSRSTLDMLIFNNSRQKKVQRDEGKHVEKKANLSCWVSCIRNANGSQAFPDS